MKKSTLAILVLTLSAAAFGHLEPLPHAHGDAWDPGAIILLSLWWLAIGGAGVALVRKGGGR